VHKGLKAEITDAVENITTETLKTVIKNLT
jgi:hypothetical protein